jgi:predicted nucleic acid-binding protein
VIVLDTNVVSELARPRPSQPVIDWVDKRDSSNFLITALTAAEMRAGVAVLPNGRRKRDIGSRVEALLTDTFAGLVLCFDIDSSDHYAEILVIRIRAGQPISVIDAQIAAVCRQHQCVLATRNVTDFAGTGIELVNPWDVLS